MCDKNTLPLARSMGGELPMAVLEPGEENKRWEAVEKILLSARRQGLGRDGFFIGVGGGAVCDLAAFAASVYMRGTGLILCPTSLLGMVDASLGGKTGFDLGGIKNLAGTFYPAALVFIAAEALHSLPGREWKSGMAELIKTALLERDPSFFSMLQEPFETPSQDGGKILALIEKAVRVKGSIVEADPRETGGGRILLNLGHTFGHALESALGLGTVSHGQAVAWGLARSCELGQKLGITPPERGREIQATLKAWNYETSLSYPLTLFSGKTEPEGRGFWRAFKEALFNDKKKETSVLRFVVPAAEGAQAVTKNALADSYIGDLCSGGSFSPGGG
ncbi:MAG: 3-dehydroquinate synthase [Treponema sp.]|nr:3-dehydroquinate synthase [Treponema sp.]